MKFPRDIPASVRQRLLNRAKRDRRPFNELLQYYAMERFLYRLSQSAHAGRFILKGALMLKVWRSPEFRPTLDIDMLGRTSNEEADIIAQIRDILTVEVEADGLVFGPDSIRAERIAEDADYEGIRIRFLGVLGSARINMQIDIGFGDVVYPEPEEAELPTMLDSPAPRLLCYSRESAIAEKLEAMIKLGVLNSRMKDFYDIWLLSRQFDFAGAELVKAVRLTFERRCTVLPAKIEAFTEPFISAKQTQWAAFWKRLGQDPVPASFGDIVAQVDGFLSPIVAPLSSGKPNPIKWTAPGPWAGAGGFPGGFGEILEHEE
ncbi:MAG TPA: nucleotidyl transferase AbiEii/AbiGii toxin family protein [Rhizobiales bacterium]|nr:nucleotidyl transferase AbiEii/AbiGii toxin family protein [Gammaproteobacteria bacterium]HDO51541.1 nucleotidyl transferase AbiEii/AbiGii toxin family protein [Hyphomicrobiales bacterium]